MTILIINGPNLNMLGKREADIYGNTGLKEIEAECKTIYTDIEFYQSNIEGEIVSKIQDYKNYSGIIINAGAYTHTSVAIHDALRLVDIPIIEVHISNIYKREEFRHKSYISSVASGIIAGLGTDVYKIALQALVNKQSN